MAARITRTNTVTSDTSLSSFDVVSSPPSVVDDAASDEIVWSPEAFVLSQRRDMVRSPGSEANWSYITGSALQSPTLSSSDSEQDLSLALSGLSFSEIGSDVVSQGHARLARPAASIASQAASVTSASPSQKRRRRKRRTGSANTTASESEAAPLSPVVNQVSPTKKKKASKPAQKRQAPKAKENEPAGLGERGIVDDVSEKGDDNALVPAYDEARKYINRFLSNPNSCDKLILMQALIIELGLYSSSYAPSAPSSFWTLPDLPRSLRQAKAFIKSTVFLNIRDYMTMREQGQAALRQAMHPNKRSLMLELRHKDKRVPRQVVKQMGLNVLLVQAF
ncbi:hypothetical protein GLOTRDRAFT_126920 [Gloeophyllum trabeum ATCC 11539]|uniref:Uncharacterized protein n=1 Tax=Gloeophyllum trabeum (strain ATCC 11539 / FP-39264 / Madison 617) TaxID=670483 RepID=S7QGS5_GLOTA|nr:uncharacterized protein GLOTRDRAFT_126920 [Gloeophyllum trabeum ATCC 11539]EPQ58428.1 hypothetical protein GLOTRDRAFT_126920 [Gloeophyllum trabeum ATCC 11539]